MSSRIKDIATLILMLLSSAFFVIYVIFEILLFLGLAEPLTAGYEGGWKSCDPHDC